MGIGVISIQTNQRRENGAPFPAGSAANGLSVDPITGQIVLGNDFGDPSNPAALTSTRVIPIPGFGIVLQDTPGLIETFFFAGLMQVNTATAFIIINENEFSIERTVPGSGPATLRLNDAFAQVLQGMDSTGVYSIVSNVAGQFGSYDVQNGNWQVGLNPGGSGTFNGAQLEVVGNLTYDLFVNITGGAIAINGNNDKGKLFTNTGGASTFTLPVASNATRGLHFMFAVQQAANLIVQAPGSDTINIGNVVSVVGGTATSNAVGSTLHLVNVGNNQWVAMSSLGAWVVA